MPLKSGDRPWLSSAPVIPDPIPGVLPSSSISLFSGPSGVGKTALMAEWMVRFQTGRGICRKATNPPPWIGVIATDRPWRSHQEWFRRAGWPDIPAYSLRDDPQLRWDRFNLPTELGKLFREALAQLDAQHPAGFMPPGSLVFIDTITLYLPGNLIDYRRTAIGIAQLDKIVQQRGLTVIGTAHTAKQRRDPEQEYRRPQDRILGSMALLGYTETQIYLLGPDEVDGDKSVVGLVSHHHKPIVFELSRDQRTGLFFPYGGDALEDQSRWRLLQEIPVMPKAIPTAVLVELAKTTLDISRATVYRYLAVLEERGQVTQPVRGLWSRPEPPQGVTTLVQ